eukprot:scaffold11271_cov63-Phaeocystis_antarctica.AAC.5
MQGRFDTALITALLYYRLTYRLTYRVKHRPQDAVTLPFEPSAQKPTAGGKIIVFERTADGVETPSSASSHTPT